MGEFGWGGKGIAEVLHAGLPVLEGKKIGLNIWTRERAGQDVCGGRWTGVKMHVEWNREHWEL